MTVSENIRNNVVVFNMFSWMEWYEPFSQANQQRREIIRNPSPDEEKMQPSIIISGTWMSFYALWLFRLRTLYTEQFQLKWCGFQFDWYLASYCVTWCLTCTCSGGSSMVIKWEWWLCWRPPDGAARRSALIPVSLCRCNYRSFPQTMSTTTRSTSVSGDQDAFQWCRRQQEQQLQV